MRYTIVNLKNKSGKMNDAILLGCCGGHLPVLGGAATTLEATRRVLELKCPAIRIH